ncbi:uncharacterized protein LOC101766130 [Setaria italica]|uniref:uncharacterized protein LOC101766130 n=1 Tax=Setaria italica TaxID=4555 RepID=UPI000350C320|nr:uncharacterized protein LOC101766130 [Setaria italica]
MTLDLQRSNYNKWSSFRAMCGKFGLMQHIDDTPPPPSTDPSRQAWVQADCCVRSWLYGSVSDAALDFTMGGDDQMDHGLWTAIANRFQSNRAPRAIYPSHAFHTMTQGDLSISQYSQEMKKAADALRDVGQPVPENTLVLNLLRGLNPRYVSSVDYIADMNLNFASALDQLAITELRLANADKVVASTALFASNNPSCGSSSCRSSASSFAPLQQSGGQQSGGQQQQRRKKGYGGRRNGGSGNQQPQQSPTKEAARAVLESPAAKDGVARASWALHLRPTPPQAHAAYGLPTQQAGTTFASQQVSQPSPSWDQAGLVAALQQQMAL